VIYLLFTAGEVSGFYGPFGPYSGNSGFLVCENSLRKANGDILVGPDLLDLVDSWSVSFVEPP
jgi:hypothetical protein